MARNTFEWTDVRVQQAIALRLAGFSARDIGERLGITRCAVLGKFHRLRLAEQEASK